MLDKQKAFNTAYHGLAAQGFKRSVVAIPGPDLGAGCRYRGPDGKRCALGYMIPDEIYNKNLEGKGPGLLPKSFCDFWGIDWTLQVLHRTGEIINQNRDIEFLSRLQMVHDNPDECSMQVRLVEFARIHKLTVPELQFETKAPVSKDEALERSNIFA